MDDRFPDQKKENGCQSVGGQAWYHPFSKGCYRPLGEGGTIQKIFIVEEEGRQGNCDFLGEHTAEIKPCRCDDGQGLDLVAVSRSKVEIKGKEDEHGRHSGRSGRHVDDRFSVDGVQTEEQGGKKGGQCGVQTLYRDSEPEEVPDDEKDGQDRDEVKEKVGNVIGHHVVAVPRCHDPHLIVDGVGDHEQGTVHPRLGVPAEGGGVFEKHWNVRRLPNVDIFLDVVKIVVVPVGGEAVGIKEAYDNRDKKNSEKHRPFFVYVPDG